MVYSVNDSTTIQYGAQNHFYWFPEFEIILLIILDESTCTCVVFFHVRSKWA